MLLVGRRAPWVSCCVSVTSKLHVVSRITFYMQSIPVALENWDEALGKIISLCGDGRSAFHKLYDLARNEGSRDNQGLQTSDQ